tara:strand:- start:565 stop:1050 length:486 start_codon:yes stop_codon:yes gene_type:complete
MGLFNFFKKTERDEEWWYEDFKKRLSGNSEFSISDIRVKIETIKHTIRITEKTQEELKSPKDIIIKGLHKLLEETKEKLIFYLLARLYELGDTNPDNIHQSVVTLEERLRKTSLKTLGDSFQGAGKKINFKPFVNYLKNLPLEKKVDIYFKFEEHYNSDTF